MIAKKLPYVYDSITFGITLLYPVLAVSLVAWVGKNLSQGPTGGLVDLLGSPTGTSSTIKELW